MQRITFENSDHINIVMPDSILLNYAQQQHNWQIVTSVINVDQSISGAIQTIIESDGVTSF